jgi:TM2 domain-containing membrane protein YozV
MPAAKAADEIFCPSCGGIIKQKAEICPKCGVRKRAPFDKTALLVITFFLGGMGGHKFYLGKTGQGILYLLFCCTGIPFLISLVEFITYASTSRESLEAKFTTSGGLATILAAVGGFFVVVILIGILSAMFIPRMFEVFAEDKVGEAAVVIANWEILQSACAGKEKAAGEAHIGFPNDGAASRYWSYAFEPEGETGAVFTAKAKRDLGKCRANSILKSTFDAKKNRFVHEGDAACRNFVPEF